MFGRVYVADERDLLYDAKVLVRKTYKMRQYWLYAYPEERFYGLPYSPGITWYQWALSSRSRFNAPFPTPLSPYDFHKAGQVKGGAASIRGGAKLLREIKVIRSYYWTTDVDVIANYLLNYGSVVVGSSWREGMMLPSPEVGMITPTGSIVGQHAYLVDGVNLRRQIIRLRNTWGNEWGRKGYAYMTLDDFSSLLDDDGEVCLPVGFGKKWVK